MKTLLPLLLLFCAPAAAAEPAKYSPVNGAVAVPLALDNAYFRDPAVPAYDYWALSAFYAPQQSSASCSAASVAMALNALLNARRARGDEEENITEEGAVGKVSGLNWKELAGDGTADGRRGLTLAQLEAAAGEALAAYGGKGTAVRSVTVSTRSAQALESFRRSLAENERNQGNVMLLHFAQDALTGAPGGPYPHISPVGAYDEKTRRVLIFDVDRRWYEPYWAADIQVFRAMAVKTRAFGHGGYVIMTAGN